MSSFFESVADGVGIITGTVGPLGFLGLIVLTFVVLGGLFRGPRR